MLKNNGFCQQKKTKKKIKDEANCAKWIDILDF